MLTEARRSVSPSRCEPSGDVFDLPAQPAHRIEHMQRVGDDLAEDPARAALLSDADRDLVALEVLERPAIDRREASVHAHHQQRLIALSAAATIASARDSSADSGFSHSVGTPACISASTGS
jgi:hypothetical protein